MPGLGVPTLHDYRVLAAYRITDPNGNRTAVGFDTRGLVVWTAVMGKQGAGEGDTAEDPTTVLEYDLFAWRDRGEPVFWHVQSRETHGDPATRWLHAYTYSDGFGGVLLEKASAAPGLAPQRDANGALVLDSNGAPTLAQADPRWVGTGRVVLDNKGYPIRQYEPYFSSTHTYEAEVELREQGVSPVMHYDPLGRLLRTQWPDGTESRVEFSPWFERRFDRNDTVLGTSWYAERVALVAGDPERRAAELTAAHADTPATAHLDALGRPFLQVDHNRDDLGADVFSETRLQLDTIGNVLQVTDARGNVAEAREHGLLRQALRVTSEDAGARRVLRTVLGEPHRSWNSRGFVTTLEYDAARRPLRTVVTRPDASTFTAVRMVYGENVASPEASNLRGQVFRVYDGAGLQQSNAFDFKGNLVSQSRQLTVAYDTTPSWTALDGLTSITDLDTAAAPLLETETFTTTATFDALGRPVTQTTPDASVLQLGYDDGGKLLTVSGNIRGAVATTDFVTSIEYDARGQRQRIDYGNGTATVYEHDPLTFRLRRLHTTNTAGTVTHQDLRYTFDPVGNITEIRDLAQPVVFTNNAAVSADQRFVYDALYRLTQAEGREHGSQGQPIADDFIPRAAPDDPTGLRAYTESYAYDLVGNILQLQHQAPGGNWTRHYDYAATGNRLLATSAPGDGPGVFSHAYQYNAHGSMTAMPHLAQVDWDHADRMQSADLGGGGTVWFLYDSAGNRVRKIRVNQTGTSTYERVYLGGYEVYRERIGTELQLERQTLHVSDDTGRICLVETKTVDDADVVPLPANISRYQYGNHLGSVGMELDETGQLISYEEFHPYGTTAYRAANSAIDVSPSRYRYTGKERDEETGLGHHGARYYASWLGRWTAADPIGLGDGINRFAYVRGSPVGLDDPSGTASRSVLPDIMAAQTEVLQRIAVVGHEGGDISPLMEELELLNAEFAEQSQIEADEAARRAEQQFQREYERVQNLASPDSLHEDFPEHMEPYLLDQSAGIQDDFLKFNAQAQQRMSRSLSRVTGGVRYTTNIAMGAMGLAGEASMAAQSPARGAFESVRALARARDAVARGEAIPIEVGMLRTAQIRSALKVGNKRTVAFAEVDVPDMPREVVAFSGGDSKGRLATEFMEANHGSVIAGNNTRTGPGRLDAEVKILDDLRQSLSSDSKGTIRLFVDQPQAKGVCQFCTEAILQFRQDFPGINLLIGAN